MIKPTTTEKIMLFIAAVAAAAGLIGGYLTFVAGLVMGATASLLLQRWQMAGTAELDAISPRKAFNRSLFRALVRSLLAFALLILSLLGGVEFLLGTFMGLILQVLAYMGEAVLIIMGKGG